MASTWKKHFTYIAPNRKFQDQTAMGDTGPTASGSKFSSYLPEVYAGQPQRRERYNQYDVMDSDAEINVSLDTIAEFCTQTEEHNKTPFEIEFYDDVSETETTILHAALSQWVRLNQFNKRIYKIFRNAIKYGDQFFIRDPETNKWLWVDPAKVQSIIVNQAKGKKPEHYVVTDLDPNLQANVATTAPPASQQTTGLMARSPGPMTYSYPRGDTSLGRFTNSSQMTSYVDANNIVHISLSDGMDNNWPFGNSILESIYKVYKQKELLEDAIIIYRVQRAPERRVFYVDVGNMPTHKAMAFVERVKQEIHQRRIPNRTGGGASIMDASYNPLSMLEDYFFAQTCLSLDTKIPLLSGEEKTLEMLINDYENGVENYVYGLDNKTFELEPAKIVWAGVTRKNTQVLKVTLDNGEEVIATPDHRFITRNGKEIEAQDLKVGQSLMPLDLYDSTSGPNQNKKKYKKYVSNADGKAKFVHITISEKPYGRDYHTHHKDFNSFNNNPDNLEVMLAEEHIALHRNIGTYSLKSQWSDPIKRQKLISGIHKLYENPSEEFKQALSKRNKENGKATWLNKESSKKVIIELKKTQTQVAKRKTVQYSIDMFNRMDTLFDEGHNSISKLIKVLRNDDLFQNCYREANPNILRDKSNGNKLLPTDTTLNKLVNVVGFKLFGDWKQNKLGCNSKFSNKIQNHKIIKIEWLEEKIDTGDITIESKSNSHWFGLSSGIYVHNSEGRGSKVETLPGGDQLGQIDDLLYFDNKLRRGLRIPSSYLPGGAEDGNTTYTDGRVGTAYIQEYRFAKFCKRLQELLIPEFDSEFKKYLKSREINIDTSIFEIKFNEPQSFSRFRQIEIDSAHINVFQPLSEVGYMSKRFLLKRFLNLKEEEILENEKLWKAENPDKTGTDPGQAGDAAGVDLGDVGISGGGDDFDLGGDEGGDLGGDEGGDTGSDAGAPAPATGGGETGGAGDLEV